MSKSGAVIILVIVAVLVLALGFFAVYPTVINYGEYKQYHSPLSLIQASSLYTDNEVGTYTLKLNTDAKAETVVKQIKQRLSNAYGYYGSNVSVKDDELTVVVPVTANSIDNASADTILSNVTAIGKVEVTNLNANSSGSNGSQPNYSSSSVVLKPTHFKSASSRRYISGTSTFYICEVLLVLSTWRKECRPNTTQGGLIMAKKKGSLANAIMALPWIVRVILVIFADFIYGIARFVDGLAQRNVLKAVVGFLWIFYGLGIGWVLDIICVLFGIRPFLF